MRPAGEPRGRAVVPDGMARQRLRPRYLATGLCALAGLLAAACSGLAPEPSRPSDLTGHWALDAAASADFDAAVTRMLAEHRQKMRKNRRQREFDADGGEMVSGSRAAPGFPPLPEEPAERVRRRLEETLRPPASLVIEVGAGTVSLKSDDEPPRVFYPGQRVGRIDVGGSAQLDAGWAGPTFVVQEKYVSGASRVQRYTLQSQGRELQVSLKYTDPYSGSLELNSLYRRR